MPYAVRLSIVDKCPKKESNNEKKRNRNKIMSNSQLATCEENMNSLPQCKFVVSAQL